MRDSIKSIIWYAVKMSFALALVGYLIMQDKLNPEILIRAPFKVYYILSVLLIGFSLWFANLRWLVLLRSQELVVSQWETMKLTLIGTFFNFALPSSVGGDAMKAFYLAKDNKGLRLKVVTSVFMDRLVGLVAMIYLAIFAALADFNFALSKPELHYIFLGLLAFGFFLTAFFIFCFAVDLSSSRRINRWSKLLAHSELLLRAYDDIRSYTRAPGAIFWSVLLSWAAQGASILFMITIGLALGDTSVPISVFFIAAPIGYIAMSLPIAPGGIGVGQVVFIWLFNMYSGAPTEVGQTAITAQQILTFGFGLAGAYFYTRAQAITLEKATS